MTFFKKLIIVLFCILLILIGFLWLLSKTVNPSLIKDYVSTQLSVLTSQTSRIDGDINWQLFPQPGIRLTSVHVGNMNEIKHYALDIDNLLFNLKLSPLLRGKLVFSEIEVKGFKIAINADSNYATSNQTTVLQESDNQDLNNQFDINRLSLSNGTIIINHDNHKATLSNLYITAEQINLNSIAFPFQLKTKIDYLNPGFHQASMQLQFKGNTSLSSQLLSNPILFAQSATLNGQLSVQNVKIDNLKIIKATATMRLKQSTLQLNPIAIGLYNGEAIGDLRYENRNQKSLLNLTANGLNSAKFTKDLFNKTLLHGGLDFSVHAQSLLTTNNWQDNTLANGNLSIRNGALATLNISKVIKNISNKINILLGTKTDGIEPNLDLKSFTDPESFTGGTPFSLMSLQYTIENGLFHGNNMFLQTDILQLKGTGQLNLDNYAVASNLQAVVTVKDDHLLQIQQFLGGGFPLIISGKLTDPVILPDTKLINPILTRVWLKETLTKPVKQIQEKLKAFFR